MAENLQEINREMRDVRDSLCEAALRESRLRAEYEKYEEAPSGSDCETCGSDHAWDAVYWAYQEALSELEAMTDAYRELHQEWVEALGAA